MEIDYIDKLNIELTNQKNNLEINFNSRLKLLKEE